MKVKSPRLPALIAFGLGVCVLFELGRWTRWAVQSSQADENQSLWIACFAVVLAATSLSGWLLIKSSTSPGMIIAFSLCGAAIAVAGALVYYIEAMLASQAMFYHAHGANQSLTLSRVGLGWSVGTFVMCAIIFIRSLWIRS